MGEKRKFETICMGFTQLIELKPFFAPPNIGNLIFKQTLKDTPKSYYRRRKRPMFGDYKTKPFRAGCESI